MVLPGYVSGYEAAGGAVRGTANCPLWARNRSRSVTNRAGTGSNPVSTEALPAERRDNRASRA